MPYSIIVAGSTSRTLQCIQALSKDARFEISAVLTPIPKVVGRKKAATPNPVHQWATDTATPSILVEKRIDTVVKEQVENIASPDFLLVVDFGYIVPQWLLELPSIAPVNVHPSALPRWRGSSPGQFVLLHAEPTSAVTIMLMHAGLDTGPILKQIPFEVSENWTQTEYYQKSFALVTAKLAETLAAFATEEIDPTDQPTNSPTPIARRLDKADSFVPWSILETALAGEAPRADQLPELLQSVLKHHPSVAHLLVSASKAFQPWPGLWTLIPTSKGEVRMKLLNLEVLDGYLQLKQVHVAGHDEPVTWNQVKSILV